MLGEALGDAPGDAPGDEPGMLPLPGVPGADPLVAPPAPVPPFIVPPPAAPVAPVPAPVPPFVGPVVPAPAPVLPPAPACISNGPFVEAPKLKSARASRQAPVKQYRYFFFMLFEGSIFASDMDVTIFSRRKLGKNSV